MLIWLVLFDFNRNSFGGASNRCAWECGEHLRQRSVSIQQILPPAPTKGTESSNNFCFHKAQTHCLQNRLECMYSSEFLLRGVIKLHFYLQFRASSRGWTSRDAEIAIWMKHARLSIKFFRLRFCFRLEMLWTLKSIGKPCERIRLKIKLVSNPEII